MYLDNLKFCVVCIDGRRYVCCSECNVVSNECNEPTSCRVQPIDTHGGGVMYLGCVCFRGELGFRNCDDICMCVMNKQFILTCSMMRFLSILLLGRCPCVLMCTSMLKETIDYYKENKTDCYLLLLDAPKAGLNIINYSIDCVT